MMYYVAIFIFGVVAVLLENVIESINDAVSCRINRDIRVITDGQAKILVQIRQFKNDSYCNLHAYTEKNGAHWVLRRGDVDDAIAIIQHHGVKEIFN